MLILNNGITIWGSQMTIPLIISLKSKCLLILFHFYPNPLAFSPWLLEMVLNIWDFLSAVDAVILFNDLEISYSSPFEA